MSSIIMRSAFVAWGQTPPPDLAYVVNDHKGRHVVTWAKVMENRHKRQAERLARKRHVVEWRACKIWVAYFDQWLMGGWHAFIEDYRGDGWRTWIDRDRPHLAPQLMAMFPLIPNVGKVSGYSLRDCDAWHEWKILFARRYKRRVQCRRYLGVAYAWWDQTNELRPLDGGSA